MADAGGVTMSHAFLSCSGASSWMKCSAYPTVAAQFPDDESEDAMRGTAAHWLLENALRTLKHRQKFVQAEWLGRTAPNGIIIDDDIMNPTMESVSEVQAFLYGRPDLWDFTELEFRVQVTRVHATHCWGTADIIIFDRKNNFIHVLDFKYGHVYVEPWLNWQLILYAIGAVDKAYRSDEGVRVTMRTLQPRCYSNQKALPWEIDAIDLRNYANQARDRAEAIMGGDMTASTGSHCYYCPGRHACSAYLRAGENALEFSELVKIDIPTAEATGVELQMIDRALSILESRRIALAEHAEALIRSGKDVPGYRMADTRATLKWTKSEKEILTLAKLLNINLQKPPVLITPTQAINAGVDPSIVQKYAQKQSSGKKLAAFNQLETIKIFKRGK